MINLLFGEGWNEVELWFARSGQEDKNNAEKRKNKSLSCVKKVLILVYLKKPPLHKGAVYFVYREE